MEKLREKDFRQHFEAISQGTRGYYYLLLDDQDAGNHSR